MSRTAGFLFVLVAALASVASWSAGAVELTPHHAKYRLGLASSQRGAVKGVDGTMESSLELACNGWIQRQRTHMEITLADGTVRIQDVAFEAWEGAGGGRYIFRATSQTDGKVEAVRGEASARAREAVYLDPRRTVALPEDTLFPIGHTRHLIERAAAGARRVDRPLFNGGDGGGARLAVAWIGQRVTPGTVPGAKANPLLAGEGWSVGTAFFPPDGPPPPAQPRGFDLEAVQLANGVVPLYVFDYGPFSVEAQLQEVRPLARPRC